MIYAAFGLTIDSEVPLPLPAGAGAADVWVRRGAGEGFRFGGLAASAREIWVDGADERLVLGAGLGIVLHERGFLVLHATTVTRDGEAVAFLGEPGAGKSSLGAAFLSQGWELVSDDVTAVDDEGLVRPGYPRMKLSRDAAEAFGFKPGPRVHPEVEKHWVEVGSFAPGPAALRRALVLAPAPNALMALVRHSYCPALLGGDAQARHFAQCGRLVERIEIAEACPPRGWEALSTFCVQLSDHRRRGPFPRLPLAPPRSM